MAPGRRQALTAVAVAAPSNPAPNQRHRGPCPHMGGGSSGGQSGSTSE